MCIDCLIHGHQYEIIDKIDMYINEDDNMPYGTTYVQRCKKCGKIKKKKVVSIFHTL